MVIQLPMSSTPAMVAYQRQMSRSPRVTKSLTAAVVGACGALLSSLLAGKPIDWKNVRTFFLWNFMSAGTIQHSWYSWLDARFVVSGAGFAALPTLLPKMAFDRLAFGPPWNALNLICVKLLNGDSMSSIMKNFRPQVRGGAAAGVVLFLLLLLLLLLPLALCSCCCCRR